MYAYALKGYKSSAFTILKPFSPVKTQRRLLPPTEGNGSLTGTVPAGSVGEGGGTPARGFSFFPAASGEASPPRPGEIGADVSTDRTRTIVLFSLWCLLSIGLALAFFRAHPPRPSFGAPIPSPEPCLPWSTCGLSIGGALLFALLLFGAGSGLARIARITARPATAAGFGMLYAMIAGFLLLAAGLFRPLLLGPVLLLPILAARLPARPPRSIPRPGWPEMAALLLLALALAGVLVRTLAPLTANDPIVYHMTLARSYAEEGAFRAAPDLVYAKAPHGIELLYGGAFLFGGEGGARLFHLLLLAANLLVLHTFVRQWLPGRPSVGALLLFATLPLVTDPRTVGNVDLGASLFFGLSLIHLARYRRDRLKRDLVAAALFAGGLLSVKLSSYVLFPILLFFPFLPLGDGAKRASPGDFLLFLVLSPIPLIPWLIRAWIETGNPVFPLLYSVFGGEGWDPVLGERLVHWQRSIGMGREAKDYLVLPWNIVFHGHPTYDFFDGILSPALLLWLPWVLLRGTRPARRLLLLLLVGVYLWGVGPQQLRFLLPLLLPWAAVAGAFWRSERGVLGHLQAALFLAICAALLFPFLEREGRDTLPVVLGRESRTDYLDRTVQSHLAFREAALRVPPGETILLVWENRIYYLARPTRADSFFEASRVVRLAEETGSPEALLDRLKGSGVRWVLVNRPLQRVFERDYPRRSIEILNRAWGMCEQVGAWNGLELYRVR